MLIIGIVGGIASGKSAVAASFKELGAFVLDADRAGHQVLHLAAVRDQIRNTWGSSVFQENGDVDRKQLGAIVFHPTDGQSELPKLEQITHPLIKESLVNQVRTLKESGEFSVAVLDAPVMFKAGWNDFCDYIVFVESRTDDRLNRALQRGWTKAEFERRESAQVSIDWKRKKSDWIIRNEGSLSDLKDQVSQIWQILMDRASIDRAESGGQANSGSAINSTDQATSD